MNHIEWCSYNSPDLISQVATIINPTSGLVDPRVCLLGGFQAGEEFQRSNPDAVLDRPDLDGIGSKWVDAANAWVERQRTIISDAVADGLTSKDLNNQLARGLQSLFIIGFNAGRLSQWRATPGKAELLDGPAAALGNLIRDRFPEGLKNDNYLEMTLDGTTVHVRIFF